MIFIPSHPHTKSPYFQPILPHPVPSPSPSHKNNPTTKARPTGIQEKNYIYKKRNYRQDVRVGACITQKEKKS
jgi:hypothetical protein